MIFISNETNAAKPDAWRSGPLVIGPNTSLGENFFRLLLIPPPVRQHYTTKLDTFFDELAFLAAVRPDLFQEDRQKKLMHPIDQAEIAAGFCQLLSAGRQHKARVVFTEQPFPEDIFNPELRKIRQRIIDKNGPDEWFAQLIMNEFHDHLGAYSIIGVKMGLRAAELLNAPPHSLKVASHVKPGPPLSCLNDGVIVATGSTPGRNLYFQGSIDEGLARVSFSYNGKTVTLTLKSEYQQQVRQHIENLLKEYTLDDPEYWDGVRRKGLDIWENWHRLDLFAITESPGTDLR